MLVCRVRRGDGLLLRNDEDGDDVRDDPREDARKYDYEKPYETKEDRVDVEILP